MESKELMEKARSAKSAEQLLAIAKENGTELTEEEAAAYFAQLNKSGELSDEELGAVAGGGCHTRDGKLVVSDLYSCDHFMCTCGKMGEHTHHDSYGAHHVSLYCYNCAYYEYEKGLFVCTNPANIK